MNKGIDRLAMVVDYELGRTVREVAGAHGCTYGYVSRVLKAARVVPRRRGREAAPPMACAHCGGQTRNERYCSPRCYHRAIYNPRYVQWRQGQRVARALVEACGFPLLPGYVVHHVDTDDRHNAVENLWVFASKGDHMAFHRLGYEMRDRQAVWKGGVVQEA
jgi:hypothetical protein